MNPVGLASILIGLCTIALSIPLLIGKIPPNPRYGFRFKRALENESLWYEVNRYGAKHFILWSLFLIAAGFAMAPKGVLPDANWVDLAWSLFVLLTYLIPTLMAWRFSKSVKGGGLDR